MFQSIKIQYYSHKSLEGTKVNCIGVSKCFISSPQLTSYKIGAISFSIYAMDEIYKIVHFLAFVKFQKQT
jgi:hypothetical protein